MTLATWLTSSRFLLTLIFVVVLLIPSPFARALAFGVFLTACFTDYLDGWVARRFHSETKLGAFLDPIADKVLILSAFIVFVSLALVPPWMVVIIVTREVLVTWIRLFLVSRGAVIPSAASGKQKVVSQMVVINAILAFLALQDRLSVAIQTACLWMIALLMWVAVLMTLLSGLLFFVRNGRLLRAELTR